jgi:Domain of unknown function (DUF4384)
MTATARATATTTVGEATVDVDVAVAVAVAIIRSASFAREAAIPRRPSATLNPEAYTIAPEELRSCGERRRDVTLQPSADRLAGGCSMTSLVLFPLLLASASPQELAAAPPLEPRVRIWLDSDIGYERGERARVHVRAQEDGYLVVLHADAQGIVRVLFPVDPYVDAFVRAGELVEIRARGDRAAFLVDERAGSGVVLAAWSHAPFWFDGFARGDHWDYGVLAPIGAGADAEAVLLDLVHEMSEGRGFDYDLAPYVVGSARPTGGGASYSVGYDTWSGPRVNTSYATRSGFHLSLNFGVFAGDPWFRAGAHYDPFYYDPYYHPTLYYDPFYRPIFYRPLYYDPFYRKRHHRRVWVYDPFYWVPVYRHRYGHPGIGVHVRYASGWCRYDAFCGHRRARPRAGYATGVGLAANVPWRGIDDYVGRGFGDRGAGIASGTGSLGRTAVGRGTGSGLDGRSSSIGARVGSGNASGAATGRSGGRIGAGAPRPGDGSSLRGVIIGSRDAPGSGNATGSGSGGVVSGGRIGDRSGSGAGSLGGRAAQPRSDGSVGRGDGGTGRIGDRTGSRATTRPAAPPTTRSAAPPQSRSGRIGGVSRSSPTTRSAEPPPSRSGTAGRIGGTTRSNPSTRAAPPPATRSGTSGRIGGTTRSNPSTRAAPPPASRSGTSGRIGGTTRSNPSTRAAPPPASRSSAPGRVGGVTRGNPTTRSSEPPAARSGGTGRIGGATRPSPTSRAAQPRSGSVSRSAPSTRNAPARASSTRSAPPTRSAPARASSTRSAPPVRSSPPPRSRSGSASGGASSRGSSSRRGGSGRIGGG